MRLTSKGRYAVRAMLDLTFYSNGNPVRLQEISNRQAISLHYLEQLFRKLRTGRVVKSVRGPGGGYVLARSMDEISIKDILDCVGENINPARDILGVPSSGVDLKAAGLEANYEGAIIVDTLEFRLTKSYFENLGNLMQEYLTTATLGDLFRKSKSDASFQAPSIATTVANNIANGFNSQNFDSTIKKDEAATSTATSHESAIRRNIGEINQ